MKEKLLLETTMTMSTGVIFIFINDHSDCGLSANHSDSGLSANHSDCGLSANHNDCGLSANRTDCIILITIHSVSLEVKQGILT